MMILSQSIGRYTQTLKINMCGGDNEVEVNMDGKELYKGKATHIIDEQNKLTFKDVEGKQHEYVKYNIVRWA